MGAMQNNGTGSRKARSKRGSVKNTDRLADFGNRNVTGGADWAGCDCKWIQAVVVEVTALGGAATFGMSRDRGAHSLTLMLDDNRKTLWYNGDADLSEELETVTHMLEAMH